MQIEDQIIQRKKDTIKTIIYEARHRKPMIDQHKPH